MVLRLLFIFIFLFLSLPLNAYASCCWVFEENKCYSVNNPEQQKGCLAILKGTLYEGADCLFDALKKERCFDKATGKMLELENKVKSTDFRFQVPFPGSDKIEKYVNTPDLLGWYIVYIFRLGVYLAITFAIFMIMFAGFLWLSSGGSRERISKAQDYIKNAVAGLVVALASFIILQTVNPSLTVLKLPRLKTVEYMASGDKCCWNASDQRIVYANTGGLGCAESFGNTIEGSWIDCPAEILDIKTCCIETVDTVGKDERDVKRCFSNLMDKEKGKSKTACLKRDLVDKVSGTSFEWSESTQACLNRCGVEKLEINLR